MQELPPNEHNPERFNDNPSVKVQTHETTPIYVEKKPDNSEAQEQGFWHNAENKGPHRSDMTAVKGGTHTT